MILSSSKNDPNISVYYLYAVFKDFQNHMLALQRKYQNVTYYLLKINSEMNKTFNISIDCECEWELRANPI